MAEKKAFHKSKRFYIISAILLILFFAGFLFWRNYKYKLVDKKLDNLISVKSKGLYQLNYKNLVINEELGNLSAEDVEMIPDSEVYQNMTDHKTAPKNLFFIRIPKLTVTGVITPKVLLSKEISAHIIRIENANIEIRLSSEKKETQPGLNRGRAIRFISGDTWKIKKY